MTNSKLLRETLRQPFKIYVGISRPRGKFKPAAWLIRFTEIPKSVFEPRNWFKLYKASHVFLAFPAHEKRGFYLASEAVASGVRYTSEFYFEHHAHIVDLWCFTLPEEIYREIKIYIEENQGAPYPLKENIGIGIQRFFKWFFRVNIKNPFDEGSSGIKCSELFFRAVLDHFKAVRFDQIREDLINEKGEWLSSDIDSLGVRDTELVLHWLASKGYCQRAKYIAPVQNSSALKAA